jgi:hypothetical protein
MGMGDKREREKTDLLEVFHSRKINEKYSNEKLERKEKELGKVFMRDFLFWLCGRAPSWLIKPKGRRESMGRLFPLYLVFYPFFRRFD